MTAPQHEDENDVLGEYKGLPILSTSIVVNKLGDGLSKAVGIAPVVIEAGVPAFLAVRVTKTKDRYDVVKDQLGAVIGYELVQVFDATGATFTDEKLVGKKIQKTVDAIVKDEAERKRGQLSLVMPEDEDDDELPPRAQVERDKHPDLANQVDDALGHLD
jgi:hypothetical protein